jgi:hypothetical protein
MGEGSLGFFGFLAPGAMVRDLGLIDANIVGSSEVGALAGFNGGMILGSYTSGTVIGTSCVGGLVGDSIGAIIASHSSALVTQTHDEGMGMLRGVGGLVGVSWEGNITACYSNGMVRGISNVGGLVGSNFVGGITMSYSSSEVIGESYVGGLVGFENVGQITSSFWDTQTSGEPNMCGNQEYCDDSCGKTTAEMKDINTYLSEGWDLAGEVINGTCDYWQMLPGDYPRLQYCADNGPVMPEGMGTVEQPYLIRDARDLGTVWFEPTAHYRLETSLDLSGITWSMAVVPRFDGTLEGNGYAISNLHIQGGGYLGLFGQLSSEADISNLGLERIDVNGVNLAGGLAGLNQGALSQCYVVGSISGKMFVGGLVGRNGARGAISRCCATCSIEAEEYSGGLVGGNVGEAAGWFSPRVDAVISDCYSIVQGNSRMWGLLVGVNGLSAVEGGPYPPGDIINCYAAPDGTETVHSYGLVGCDFGSVVNSFWDAQACTVPDSSYGCPGGGVAKTTAEMQTASTFLDAGWDFVGETENGPNDTWTIVEGQTYPLLSWQKYGGGTGEPNDPYRIYTAEHLNELGAEPNDYDKHFKLMADIDLSGYTYDRAVIAPDVNDIESGFQGNRFVGLFDGNGHKISHLKIAGTNHLALFGYTGSGATISSLGLEAVDVSGTGSHVGALVVNNIGSIATSYSTGTVSGRSWIGGLVSWNGERGSITTSHSTSTVTGNQYVGGLMGANGASVSTSYSTGSVNGQGCVGGLVGDNYGHIVASYSTGIVNGTGTSVGGLVGINYRSITASFSTGTVTGGFRVAGLVGWVTSNGVTTASFWDIETSGQVTSDGGIGLTTAEMQTATTFLQAGWDFVGETANGTDDIWWIDEGQDYPRLWWEASDL